MTEPTVARRVHIIIAWQMSRGTMDPTETVLPADAQLIVDLGADRRDVTDILAELERAFGIEIPNDDSVPWSVTVGGCVELVEGLVGKK